MDSPAAYTSLDALLDMRRHCRDLPSSLRRVQPTQQAGRQLSRLRGRGIDFDQVRQYQPGDDIRNIDWRVTARTRKAHTKVFNEERERPVFVLCEQSARLFFGTQGRFKSVLAAEAAALIAWMALAHNDRIGGMVFDGSNCHEVRPLRSRRAILQLLSLLLKGNHALGPANLSPESEPLNLALRRSREIIRPGSLLYLLCDHAAIDQASLPLLSALGSHNDLVLLPLYDALEANLPSNPALEFVQGEQRVTLNTTSSALREAWAAQFTARQQAWQKMASHLRCGLQPLDTSRPAVAQLQQMLVMHARRQG
ncbi:MAG: DUF58 domain-containing protein [Gammaproteobacteria bacterium]|nr:DUF58 domain-containing protein [Gammaproteobacteria bacterium]